MEDVRITPGNEGQDGFSGVKEMNLIQRILGVFFSPGETMKSLIARPAVLFPAIATALTAFLLYLSRYSLYMDFVKSMSEAATEGQNMQLTPEQMELNMKIVGVTFWFTPLLSLLAWLVGTAVLYGLVKIFKGQGKFKQYMSVTGYAFVILMLYYVLCGIVSFFTGNLILDTSLANVTNLFMPGIRGSYLYGLIRSLDLFVIWEYVVIAVGVRLLSELSSAKAYSIVAAAFILQLLYTAMNYKFM